MIDTPGFCQTLVNAGYSYFTCVPCSFFKDAINEIIRRPDTDYIAASNEGAALAIASGARLAGRKSAVLMQNSGLGNAVNPLTSLNMIYDIPVLMFISGRAYGVADEPQHEIIGGTMEQLLDALKTPWRRLPGTRGEFESALRELDGWMDEHRRPAAFLVPKGTLSETASIKAESPLPLSRHRAVEVIADALGPDDAVVASTGMISRELYALRDRAGQFYMMGSMGHASALALGIAMNQPRRRVVVLDGDGALIMHLGTMSTAGHYLAPNLLHICIDNEAHETTGGQRTTSSTTDFAGVARACGYDALADVSDESSLKRTLETVLKAAPSGRPRFLRVKVNLENIKDIPRITKSYTAAQIARNVEDYLKKGV